MKIWETKIRWYDNVELHERETIPVKVWKLFGFFIWRKILG